MSGLPRGMYDVVIDAIANLDICKVTDTAPAYAWKLASEIVQIWDVPECRPEVCTLVAYIVNVGKPSTHASNVKYCLALADACTHASMETVRLPNNLRTQEFDESEIMQAIFTTMNQVKRYESPGACAGAGLQLQEFDRDHCELLANLYGDRKAYRSAQWLYKRVPAVFDDVMKIVTECKQKSDVGGMAAKMAICLQRCYDLYTYPQKAPRQKSKGFAALADKCKHCGKNPEA